MFGGKASGLTARALIWMGAAGARRVNVPSLRWRLGIPLHSGTSGPSDEGSDVKL